MRRRRRYLALGALALHLAAAIALPLLHQQWHRRGGGHDHLHAGAQTKRLAPLLGAADDPTGLAVADVHQRFDADLEALDLSDAGHFGVALVDCSLAAYTLADCAEEAAAGHGFGDQLVLRTHHHRSSAPATPAGDDPGHGRHSLEHFGLALIGTPAFLLPPPCLPLLRLAAPAPVTRTGSAPDAILRARSPPARA